MCTLLDNGGIMDCTVTRRAVSLSNEILGPCLHCIGGKMTDYSAIKNHTVESRSLPAPHIGSHLHCDIVFIKGPKGKSIPILLAIEELKNYAIGATLPSKTTQSVQNGLYSIIGFFKSHQHIVQQVNTDHEAVFGACSSFLGNLGVLLKQSAPGVHARRLERFVRTIRSKMRAVIIDLPFKLPPILHESCFQSVIITGNLVPNSQSGNLAPITAITGWKPSFKGCLQHKFGDLIICFQPNIPRTDKTTPHASLAIYLYNNRGQNSAEVYLVNSGQFVTRDTNPLKFKPAPMTDDVIVRMNSLCENSGFLGDNVDALLSLMPRTITPLTQQFEEPINQNVDPPTIVPKEVEFLTDIDDLTSDIDEPTNSFQYSTETLNTAYDEDYQYPEIDHNFAGVNPQQSQNLFAPSQNEADAFSDSLPLAPSKPDADATADSIVPSYKNENADSIVPPHRVSFDNPVSQRTNYPRASKTKNYKDMYYDEARMHAILLLNAKLDSFDSYTNRLKSDKMYIHAWNITVRRALKEMYEPALKAISSELTSMITKGVLTPIDYSKLTPTQRNLVLYSHMFLKEKFLPDGEFDKLKARLVGGGDDQNKDLLVTDPSSPTVEFLTVMFIFCLACLFRLVTAVIDVKTAYLNADIDEEIYIAIDSQCSEIFCKLYPKYKRFIRQNGTLVCLVNKALYGLTQSANLWYIHIRKELEKMGFITIDSVDKCLFFRKFPDGSVIYLLLYVDDIFIAASTLKLVNFVIESLQKSFGELSIQRGLKYSYLGMTVEFSNDFSSVKLSQQGYISDILKFYNISKFANSPAKRDLLSIPKGEKAKLVDSKFFKSQLMKIAYLAIRTRPDFRFVVCFLASKSAAPTVHDQECLNHLYQFLNNSKEYCLNLSPKDLSFTVYVDASFAIHTDGKRHTGVVIQMGKPNTNSGPMYCQSSKQKLLGMNSTECELIAVNDALFTIIKCKSICTALGLTIPKIILFQDNTSAIQMALKGEGNVRKSKYMLVRISHITEEINNGLFEIHHLPTKDMIADILTKPLFGAIFTFLAHLLLNFITLLNVK
jgi:hypothetical protein